MLTKLHTFIWSSAVFPWMFFSLLHDPVQDTALHLVKATLLSFLIFSVQKEACLLTYLWLGIWLSYVHSTLLAWRYKWEIDKIPSSSSCGDTQVNSGWNVVIERIASFGGGETYQGSPLRQKTFEIDFEG